MIFLLGSKRLPAGTLEKIVKKPDTASDFPWDNEGIGLKAVSAVNFNVGAR